MRVKPIAPYKTKLVGSVLEIESKFINSGSLDFNNSTSVIIITKIGIDPMPINSIKAAIISPKKRINILLKFLLTNNTLKFLYII